MADLTVLHTSDWHIGHQLYSYRRDDEFLAFLNWLTQIITKEHVDILLIAGDIFDTVTTTNNAQKLYYDFLRNASQAGVRHIVIIAGNHDSPSFLTATQQLLKSMQIHVVGSITDNNKDEILLLADKDGKPEAIICAAPYLRERDMRTSEPGESEAEKERKLADGIRNHYHNLAVIAEEMRKSFGLPIPIIATGHLYAAGAKLDTKMNSEDTGVGVRSLYIGGMGAISPDIFPSTFDYVALGHFHKPQKVGGKDIIRYSGSPLAMGFDEINTRKEIVLIHFNNNIPRIDTIEVPKFRDMRVISGTKEEILNSLRQIHASVPANGEEIWIAVKHSGNELYDDLNEAINKLTSHSPIQVLSVQTDRSCSLPGIFTTMRNLREIEPEEMFLNLLNVKKLDDDTKKEMQAAFQELLAIVRNS